MVSGTQRTDVGAAAEVVTCTGDHALPGGALRLLGAVDGVTPTMHLLELGGVKVLVDCGAAGPGRIPPEALDADALLITHAHNDHLGGLPEMLAIGFDGPIYGTPATLEIAKVLLRDSIYLGGGRDHAIHDFVRRYRKQARPLRYGERLNLTGDDDLAVVFHEAGHILGSASVELATPAARVIISGDLGRPGSPILRDYNTEWHAERPVDLVLLETTYGDRDHAAAPADLADQLERAVSTALRDGGHILVPSFAIGRTQVLLYLLNSLVESGRLGNLPVAVDTPMGLKVTDTYRRFRRLYDRETLDRIARGDDPLDFSKLYSVKRGADSVRLRDVKQPMLIIAGSGMCTGGRIVGHLAELLPRPETCVIFIGHQVNGTPGRAIQDAAENRNPGDTAVVSIDGEPVTLRAAVETLQGISAHADRRELAAWLDAIPNVKRVALHHGAAAVQQGFAKWYNEMKKERRCHEG